MSVNGQDPRSNVYLLDGTLQNDFTNGPAGSAASTVLGVESIREFRVEANSYGAEFGRNAGGQINAISKSGTNDYHGSLYLFHRNDNLDARNFLTALGNRSLSGTSLAAASVVQSHAKRLFSFSAMSRCVKHLAARSKQPFQISMPATGFLPAAMPPEH